MASKTTTIDSNGASKKLSLANLVKTWQMDGWFIFLDLALVVTALFLIFTSAVVFLFHLVFLLLTLGAFYWKYHSFAARAIIWVTLTTIVLVITILAGETQASEIIEIPMQTAIIVLVFIIAQQRSKAQQALRGSEERYHTLFDNLFKESRDAIFITNQEDKVVDVNTALLDLFDYAEEEVLGLDYQQIFVHPAAQASFRQELEQKRFVKNQAVQLHKKDGTEMHCLLTSGEWRAYDGRVLGYQGLIRDITGLKQAEQELRQISAKNQAILNAIPDSIFHLSREGQILDYSVPDGNALAEVLSEIDYGQYLDSMPWLSPDLVSKFLDHIGRALDTGSTQIVEYQLRPVNDTRYFEAWLVVSGTDEVLAIVRDVSERKAREAALEKQRARIARDLHDSLGQNLGYLRLKLDEFTLRDELSDFDPLKKELVQMRDVANEAYELVRNMLAAARSSNSADLATVLLSQARLAGQRAQFEVNLTAESQTRSLPPVIQQQVLYIFQEALSNVERHARAQQVDVDVAWTEDTLLIKLTDDGRGFATDTSRGDGHYGLAIMQERAEEIQGVLSITSRPGAGTSIILQLPVPGAP